MSRLLGDRRGVSAVAFAITFAVLAPMTLGLFDVYQGNEQHGKLQDALDAAALYAARSTATDTPTINTIGTKALAANLQLVQGATLTSASFTLVNNNKVQAQATVRLTAFAPLEFTHSPVQVSTEVTRNGNNLEVALVLDNSNSMAGASLTSLQAAAKQLVDLVVSDSQAPFYSKVSIVPYANSVNAGVYADAARGVGLPGTDPACAGNVNSLGCPNYTYKNPSNSNKTQPVSTCVSERSGPHAYDDVSPSTALVGFNYPATQNTGTSNPCISAKMAPLSSDKVAIKASIDNLSACCSTGGHIGVAWGWYTLSPKWSGVFTGTSAPAAYGAPNTIKALVLMTDGEYNSVYCNGVIAKIATNSSASGSGDDNDHIKCLGSNGKDAYAQAQALCAAMKAPPNNVVIYTVGLNVIGTPAASDLMSKCATDAQHVYLPANGADLQVAFQAIAADLNKLRLSQ